LQTCIDRRLPEPERRYSRGFQVAASGKSPFFYKTLDTSFLQVSVPFWYRFQKGAGTPSIALFAPVQATPLLGKVGQVFLSLPTFSEKFGKIQR
jgi:hypothetical protein